MFVIIKCLVGNLLYLENIYFVLYRNGEFIDMVYGTGILKCGENIYVKDPEKDICKFILVLPSLQFFSPFVLSHLLTTCLFLKNRVRFHLCSTKLTAA